MSNQGTPRLSMRTRRIVSDTCFNFFMMILCIIVIYPVVWAIFSSFKANQQLFFRISAESDSQAVYHGKLCQANEHL